MKVRSLAACHPELAVQWHPWKNGKLHPDKVPAGSKRIVWWQCPNGHEWQAAIAARHRGAACPRCIPGVTSVPEQFLFSRIRSVFPNAVNGVTLPMKHKFVEFDVWVPDLKLAIEYDGHHHATKADKDEEKNRSAQQAGITLIRVRVTGLPDIKSYGSFVTIHEATLPSSWADCLRFIGDCILEHCETDSATRQLLQSWMLAATSTVTPGSVRIPIAYRLSDRFPALTEEWDEIANMPITPETVSIHSRKPVWWRCKQNHRWQSTVRIRVNGASCPYCTGDEENHSPGRSET